MKYNGEPVIEEIFTGQEIYGRTDNVPDILFQTTDMRYMASRYFEFGADEPVSPEPPRNLNAHHRPYGVFFASGKDIDGPKQGSIIDLAPTILHLLGQAIPTDIDGSVLDIFSDSSTATEQTPRRREDLTGLDV
jgi:predicted AlkP superfamily phosphohydrolase/phosphomutase